MIDATEILLLMELGIVGQSSGSHSSMISTWIVALAVYYLERSYSGGLVVVVVD